MSRPLLVLAVATAVVLGPGLPATASADPGCDDACRVAGARSYVEALVSHDPAQVPLHPRATRVEAGLQTGFSGPQIRRDLRFGPQYRVISAVHDERYVVREGVVVADYVLDVGLGPVPLTRARVHETFAFDGAQIRTVVADIAAGA